MTEEFIIGDRGAEEFIKIWRNLLLPIDIQKKTQGSTRQTHQHHLCYYSLENASQFNFVYAQL